MAKVRISATALLLLALIGVAPLTASAPLSAAAATVTLPAVQTGSIKVQNMNVKMIFDGVSMTPPSDQLVFMYNNTTYVPLRFMSYALQKSVSWDAKNLKVTVAEPTSTELVVIKEYLMNVGTSQNTSSKSANLQPVKASFSFNGSAKNLPTDQSSYILNGALYVPIRYLSESVGSAIVWDQKAKTITATSKAYQEQNSTSGGNIETKPTASTKPSQAGGSSDTGKVSYESITSATEAKLNALKSQSQSTLLSTAMEYLAAKDDASKQNIIAKGKQQLSSFTASFNSIVSDAEQQLKSNGYNTDIINQYRSAFESEIQNGLNKVAGMAD
ncbi:copper amine oxidase N-terminal domain-containing protein [Paenibacillus sp. P32E]|uniref:copper amine oxidase N-terminal domain-containing protein n=1 Tax=Paenibacillus sp. P32E TaxID=1349434 RepID=UPI00093CECB6|nr:copper amine oxidase N-terminal domain-containing protein [Paenibacillus sp. P32E]OKP93051.1 hypothetical protein A3848_06685 [Paenibacillus sp. P32E]